MVAGKRVPAAYRKGNRRSHLTGDTVYRTGAILVPSGKKLTVGQQRRRRQRGGTGGQEPPAFPGEAQPSPAALAAEAEEEKTWHDHVHYAHKDAYMAAHKTGSPPRRTKDGRKADFIATTEDKAGPGHTVQAEHFLAWAEDKAPTKPKPAIQREIRSAAAAHDAKHLPPAAPTPPPLPAELRKAEREKPARRQLLQEIEARAASPRTPAPGRKSPEPEPEPDTADVDPETALQVEQYADEYAQSMAGVGAVEIAASRPEFWAEAYRDAASKSGAPWSAQFGTYLYFLLHMGPHSHATRDAATQLRAQMTSDRPRRDDTWWQDSAEKIAPKVSAALDAGLGASPFTKDRTPTAADPDPTPRPAADSYPMTPESQVHTGATPAGAAPARISLVRDPETTEALQRLSLGLEKMDSSRRDVEAEDIPAVAEAMASNPEIAGLVQRGLLNPRRLSDPTYASKLREQALRRESGLKHSDGTPLYSTATSRPNTLHRGRIARSAVPVFEREGKPSARSGLKYYRRAQASRVPIFSTA